MCIMLSKEQERRIKKQKPNTEILKRDLLERVICEIVHKMEKL